MKVNTPYMDGMGILTRMSPFTLCPRNSFQPNNKVLLTNLTVLSQDIPGQDSCCRCGGGKPVVVLKIYTDIR